MNSITSIARRDDTIIRLEGNNDTWHFTWAQDDRQYVTGVEGAGLDPCPTQYANTRMYAVSGGPLVAEFRELDTYPKRGWPQTSREDTRYLNYGTLAIHGRIYQFLSSYNRSYPEIRGGGADLNALVRFTAVKLIYSPDGGMTWCNQDGSTPVIYESWGERSPANMVFFEEDQESFSMLSVLQMGRDYGLNRDGYVYVYGLNGNVDGRMNEVVMFRVATDRILSRASYEFFAGLNAVGAATWSPDIRDRAVVVTFPRGWVNSDAHPYAWLPSVVYNEGLGQYLMASWGTGLGPRGNWFRKPSYLGFWVADTPWGPWEQVHEEPSWLPGGDPAALAFQPQIAPKWIDRDGLGFWLVWSDFQSGSREAITEFLSYNDELGQRADVQPSDVTELARLNRLAMPYFSFNTQRVEISVR